MTLAKDVETSQHICEDVIFPPGDLYSDEPPMESYLHLHQMILLIKCLEWCWRGKNDFFAIGNLTIYYSPRQRKSEDFRGPDFFVVLGTERKPRKSWVVWEEDGKYPNVIVEILSNKTAETDKGLKKQIYQDTFRTPDYFWFEPNNLEFSGFHLLDGKYEAIPSVSSANAPNQQGYLWSQQLELYLGIYQGKLRFFTSECELILTPEEVAESEQKQKELAQQQVAKMAAKLREMGIDPDTL